MWTASSWSTTTPAPAPSNPCASFPRARWSSSASSRPSAAIWNPRTILYAASRRQAATSPSSSSASPPNAASPPPSRATPLPASSRPPSSASSSRRPKRCGDRASSSGERVTGLTARGPGVSLTVSGTQRGWSVAGTQGALPDRRRRRAPRREHAHDQVLRRARPRLPREPLPRRLPPLQRLRRRAPATHPAPEGHGLLPRRRPRVPRRPRRRQGGDPREGAGRDNRAPPLPRARGGRAHSYGPRRPRERRSPARGTQARHRPLRDQDARAEERLKPLARTGERLNDPHQTRT